MSNPATTSTNPRREIAKVSILGTTQLHLRNPMVIAFWSIMFPGLGQMLLSKYISGFILFIWELFVNRMAQINLGIYYTVLGQFEMAKAVVDIRWAVLYIPTYAFAIWNAYRTTVDVNKNYILASREDAQIKPFVMSIAGINYLDKSSPWTATLWSMLMPGLGQLMIHRIVVAFFLLTAWISLIYLSKFLPALHYTLLGRFNAAALVVEWQWLLSLPSIYFFSLYDAYVNTVESNKLFKWEQAKFLKRDYQYKLFSMPFKKEQKKGDKMYIASTFEHSINLELAITAIQMKGIAKEDILAIPLDKREEEKRLFDTIHSSDDLSLLNFPVILGALLSVLGLIYGFILNWGPIAWALIGMCIGFGVGLLIKLYTTKEYSKRKTSKNASEVILIIACKENQKDMVKDLLWTNSAMGVSQLSLDDDHDPVN